MNSGYSTPNNGLPHLSHAEPWAHSYICCDSDHAASTSRGSTPMTRFTTRHQSHPSISTACSFDPAACCDETACPDGDHVECCTDPSCNEGQICEDEGCHIPHGGNISSADFSSEEHMRELEEWACSTEGNHAIQQYVSPLLPSLRVWFALSFHLRSRQTKYASFSVSMTFRLLHPFILSTPGHLN